MTVSVVFAIAGVIALLFGIIGGGIKAREVEIPHLPVAVRVVTVILGLAFLGATVWLEGNRALAREPVPTQQVVTLSPASTPPNDPTATVTSTPILAQTDTPTPPSENADLEILYSKLYKAKTWNLVLQEPFDNNDNNWTLWNTEDNQKTITTQIDQGVLLLRLQAKGASQHWEIAPVSTYSDFYYSVKTKRIGSPPGGINQAVWGIIFRRQGSDLYALLLNDLQEYTLYLHQGTDWKNLIGPTKSSLINKEKSNELAVVVEGSEIIFFINGTAIKKIDDNTLSEGNVGISVGAYNKDDDVMIEFDDFELRQKP